MKKTELLKQMKAVAAPRGYEQKGSTFWKCGEELTALVNFQKSSWDDCIYVNIGALPTRVVKACVPPSDGYFGLRERASGIAARFRASFEWLEGSNNGDFAVSEMAEPLRQLIEWLEKNYLDAEKVRRAIRSLAKGEAVCKFGLVNGLMQDWAGDKLKPLAEYSGWDILVKNRGSRGAEPAADTAPGVCWSVHFKTIDIEAVTSAARKVVPKAGGSILIAKPRQTWIAAYPSQEIAGPRVFRRLAAASKSRHVVAVMLYDDDLFCYWYYRSGRLADAFCSCPDYFGESKRADLAARGKPEAFKGLLSVAARKKLRALTATRMVNGEYAGSGLQFDFESERLRKFERLLGLRNAANSYENLDGEEQAVRMIRVG